MMNAKRIMQGLMYAILALFLVTGIINCGGGSSGPSQVKAPIDMIKDFIAKHTTMVDTSLVDLYARDEQPRVAAMIQKTIDEKKAAGELDKLQNSSFDFSNLLIAVVGEKEAYVDDQPTKLIKVSVSGSYEMKSDDSAKTIQADETIILEMVDNGWRVTEKVNPWS